MPSKRANTQNSATRINTISSKRANTRIKQRYLELRESLWPGAADFIWDRTKTAGFTTIPKTMPFILKIMDEMTKGTPVSSTYLTLWCFTWDNGFASLRDRAAMANAAGFGGQRGDYTWTTRMKKLAGLSFIDIKPGKLGPMTNVIIWNPHLVIRWHYTRKSPGLTQASYNALLEFAHEIGAKDMTQENFDTTKLPWEHVDN